jgi:hypothetical protein
MTALALEGRHQNLAWKTEWRLFTHHDGTIEICQVSPIHLCCKGTCVHACFQSRVCEDRDDLENWILWPGQPAAELFKRIKADGSWLPSASSSSPVRTVYLSSPKVGTVFADFKYLRRRLKRANQNQQSKICWDARESALRFLITWTICTSKWFKLLFNFL